jgi:superfamily II DNA or RNA helicase
MKYEAGILCAQTGFGKTVVAARIIAARNTNTLILTHRQQLLEQWRDRLAHFLDISPKEIGIIGQGKFKPKGKIDIAMLQSLVRKTDVNDIVTQYGQVIIDECHHLSAFSFEQVLRKVKATYVLGLTATPIRKDGHHPIIFMQCGPIRHRANLNTSNTLMPQLLVYTRNTNFLELTTTTSFSDIYDGLLRNEDRNQLILTDALDSLAKGKNPLLLTERREHLEWFEKNLTTHNISVLSLHGGLSKKERNHVMEQIKNSTVNNEVKILLATGKFIGEGFDAPKFDTLFLTLPISWKGTLQQYIGRLYRNLGAKREIIVYDYVDHYVPMLNRMFKKDLSNIRLWGI